MLRAPGRIPIHNLEQKGLGCTAARFSGLLKGRTCLCGSRLHLRGAPSQSAKHRTQEAGALALALSLARARAVAVAFTLALALAAANAVTAVFVVGVVVVAVLVVAGATGSRTDETKVNMRTGYSSRSSGSFAGKEDVMITTWTEVNIFAARRVTAANQQR